MLPTVGGQTALNLAVALDEAGMLEKYSVELIGASDRGDQGRRGSAAVQGRDARDRPRRAAERHGARRWTRRSSVVEDASGFPSIIRPSFTLGGVGGGIAYNIEEFREIVASAASSSARCTRS